MNTLSTNAITNVYNVGAGSCDAGTKYCTNEYALYFPCLKDVTRGQNVCFDFYIADGSTQDVVDLRTVDAITLNLNGQFNCSYGSFSYPDNILSLQKEEYSQIYELDFNDGIECFLEVIMIDKDSQDVLNKIGDVCADPIFFWSGTRVYLEAKDTPTHIFVGWATTEEKDDECPDDTLEDHIISVERNFSFIIKESTTIIAIYRKRKEFNIVSDPSNKSSLFKVIYDGIYYISNRDEEDYEYNDKVDILEGVKEGYEIVVTCIPSGDRIDADSDSDDDMGWKFKQWKDGIKERCRKFIVGDSGCDGTIYFEDGDTIKLKAICEGPIYGYIEPDVDEKSPINKFDEEGIHILNKPDNIDHYEYNGDDRYIKDTINVEKYINDGGYLYLKSGSFKLSSEGIENGIKIDIHAQAASDSSDSEPCTLEMRINDYVIRQEIDDFKNYEFYFTKCNSSDIEISVDGDCIIDKIIIYKEVLIDGGKAQFCLDTETTSKIPPGPLFVNGAIAVGELGIDENGDIVVENPQSYGLTTTPIGQVNKLPKININIE